MAGSFTNIISTIAYIRNNDSDAHANIYEIFPSEMNASLANLTLDSAVIIINFLKELNAKVLDAEKDEPKNNMLLSLPKPDFSKLVHDNDDVIAAMKHKNAIFQRNNINSLLQNNIGSLLRANHNMESLILKNNIEMQKPILSTIIDSSKKEENTNNINSDYYGLFIRFGKDFSKSGKAEMEWDRSFRTNEYTDERLLKMIYTDEGYISNDIINIPMIFGDEYLPSKINQENNQLFYYGRLRNIEQNSKYVSIEYDILGNIPAEKNIAF